MSPQSNINSADRFPRKCEPAEPPDFAAGCDTAQAQPFHRRLGRAVMLMVVAIVAHLFVVRAPESNIVAPVLPAAVVTLNEDTVQPAPTPAPDELPRVTVVTKDLVALPTDDIGPRRPSNSVIRGAELLAVGTTGRDPVAAPPAIREAVHTPRTVDGAGAAISDGAPIDVGRPDEETPSKPEASLNLAPISASRKLLAGVPRSVTPPPAERVIRTAPIVEPTPDQKSLVLGVLQQYAEAFGRLDAEATKAVYPTVNYVALRRAFDQLETQRLTFESCDLKISGRDANARCQGEAAYRPRIGPRTLRRASREWTFDLAKADDGWQIVRATVR